jgi:hypothetical protein
MNSDKSSVLMCRFISIYFHEFDIRQSMPSRHNRNEDMHSYTR